MAERGWGARLRHWLGGSSAAPPAERSEPDPAERLDAARQRLKDAIEPPEDEARSAGPEE